MQPMQPSPIPAPADSAPRAPGPAGIRISETRTVGDLQSLDDCASARIFLLQEIARIENQLDSPLDRSAAGPQWGSKARAALRWKRAALAAVEAVEQTLQRSSAGRRAFLEAFYNISRAELHKEDFNYFEAEAHKAAGSAT